MSIPTFQAVIDDLPPASDRFVACLGRPRTQPSDDANLLVVDDFSDTTLKRLEHLNPALMAGGLDLVTSREAYAREPAGILRAQKILAYLFAKYVQAPHISTRVPDPLGLRAENTPEYLHQLNLLHNTPLHLRHPLSDKVRAVAIGQPCLLLLPGPSLATVRDQLPELAKHYLIVTISRVMPFLRSLRLVPDVLVQLDTVPIQAHFHHPDDRFPRSMLLALSQSPISTFAPRFRQLFFIDSFDLNVLPNQSRIRESWLSSLLACLGAVEALCAPKVLLIGADLRHFGGSVYHSEATACDFEAAPAHEAPLTTQDVTLSLADYHGRLARTSLEYFATAGEAEIFARDIQRSTGTVFANLSPQSLLDPAIFAHTTAEEALDGPPADREAFLRKMDEAATQRENIRLRALRARYTQQLGHTRQQLDVLSCIRITDPDSIPQHPCYRYVAANVPWFRPTGGDNLARLADNLARELHTATRFARNVTSLFLTASKGTAVPILCTAEEETGILSALARFDPQWSWKAVGITMPGAGRAHPSGGTIPLAKLHDWMQAQDVVVVAPGLARECEYAVSLVSGDNVLPAQALLAYVNVAFDPPEQGK